MGGRLPNMKRKLGKQISFLFHYPNAILLNIAGEVKEKKKRARDRLCRTEIDRKNKQVKDHDNMDI